MRDLLIAVKSCEQHRKAGFHEVIRKTWGSKLPSGVELRFFVGGALSPDAKDDEFYLNVKDDYHSLPFKTRAICQHVVGAFYDHVFICDTDTFVVPDRLVFCGYEQFDYAGKITKPVGHTFRYEAIDRDGQKEIHDHCYPWASGGYGYFLSNRAAEIISREYPNSWAEDLWVGQVMGAHATHSAISSDCYETRICDFQRFYQYVTWHFPSSSFKCGYDPKFRWMETMQNIYGDK